MAKAIKCDICGRLEAGTGFLVRHGSGEDTACTECFSKLDSLKESLAKRKKKTKE